MTQPPERLHAHGDPSPTHQVWEQIWLILFQRDLGNHTAGCASHTKAVPCIPVTFASTLCFHLCLPSSDTVLYMALLCGPQRLLPFLIIWLRLRVTIMTVTVLKEARLGGHPTPWHFTSLETEQKAGILTGCPGFEVYLASLFSFFLRTQIKQKANFARVSESNNQIVSYLNKVTYLFVRTNTELKKYKSTLYESACINVS